MFPSTSDAQHLLGQPLRPVEALKTPKGYVLKSYEGVVSSSRCLGDDSIDLWWGRQTRAVLDQSGCRGPSVACRQLLPKVLDKASEQEIMARQD